MVSGILQTRSKHRPLDTHQRPSPRVFLAYSLCCCLLILVTGCTRTRRSVEHVEVTGRVLLDGKPVTGGEVSFTTKDGFANKGVIDETGKYTINAPTGEVMISVDNRSLGQSREAASKGAGRPDAPPPTKLKGKYVEIPSKYYIPDTSGLTYTVTNGPQTHDILLTK